MMPGRTQGPVMAMARTERAPRGKPDERFQSAYRAYYRQVYVYFRRRTDVESAQDGCADTFLVAWRRIGDLPDESETLPWLYGIARRVLANQWRSRKRSDRLRDRLFGFGAEPERSPETIVVRAPHIQNVLDALERLKPIDRHVLLLSEWEGQSHKEIARAVGCKPHAVDQRIYRAKHRLEDEHRRAESSAVGMLDQREEGAP
jgi:RNA polymerase sigma factor (sigma-70 family)